MKLRKVNYWPESQHYPSKGNAYVPIMVHSWDEEGYYLKIFVDGRSHPDMISEAGCFHGGKWEFDVYDDGTKKRVGLRVRTTLTGFLSTDTVPPDGSYAGVDVTLESQNFEEGLKPDYVLTFKSPSTLNDAQFGMVENLLPAPKRFSLKFQVTSNVVIDQHPSSWAKNDSELRLVLTPYEYEAD